MPPSNRIGTPEAEEDVASHRVAAHTESEAELTGAPQGRPSHDGAQEGDPRRHITLAVVMVASFMILVDVSIVNVAVPSIQRSLHTTFAEIELVIAGYQVAYAVLLITGARLGDIVGRRRLFMVGLAGFVLASVACGAAPSGPVLVVTRIVQGGFGALLYPQVLSVIQVSFPSRERGRAFGVVGVVVALGLVAGPLLGGALIQSDLFGASWRLIFLINVPIGVATLVAARLLIRETRAPDRPKLDPSGVLLAMAGVGAFVFPLAEGREISWPPWTFAMLGASLPLIALFLLWERHRSRRPDGAVLIHLDLLEERAFRIGLAVAFVFFAGVPAFSLTLSVYLQAGLRFSALATGLMFVPFAIGSLAMSLPAGRLTPRFGKWIPVTGAGVLLLALAMIEVPVALGLVRQRPWLLAPGLFVYGVGLRAVITPLFTVVLSRTQGREAGSASGVLTTVQQLGGAVGIAVIGIVFFGLLGSAGPDVAFRTSLICNAVLFAVTGALLLRLPQDRSKV